jgi:hypothetical protein
MRCKCGTGILPVTGKMPVPQVLLLKWKHYIKENWVFEKAGFPLYFSVISHSRERNDS